ncbi:MAG: biotin--[acetyl-CoA-carboxylase] ligase, partial [Beijerinckiaceae bacterium]
PLWLVADEQTKGRGRLGRTWFSRPGNLYATLLLTEPCPIHNAPQLGFVAGLALHDALAKVVPEPASVRLKWPNDVLIGGAKISGILLEGGHRPAGKNGAEHAVAIGIGVNVAHHPAEVLYPATNLAESGSTMDVHVMFAALSDCMAERMAQWQAGQGFAAIRAGWMRAAAGLGQEIEVRQDQAILRGIFREIDADGRMVLEHNGKLTLVHAGDVYLNRND